MARIVLAGLVLCLAGASGLAAAGSRLPTERFRIRSVDVLGDTGAVFVMPRERVPLTVTAPAARLFSLEAPQGALTAVGPNRWTWEAPGEPGRYPLELRSPDGKKAVDVDAFVMIPSAEVRDGWLKNYRIGSYPAKPLEGKPSYVPPKGFIEVTRDNQDTKVSENFRLKQFLTKQKGDFPKYLVLDEGLLHLLEAIGEHLEARGWKADDIFIMSGYRTPFYNKLLDDTPWSMHQWGRAADIFLDRDKDGVMDDFNKDRTVDRNDAVDLAGMLDELSKAPGLSKYIGGIGIYGRTQSHGPFVHVDTRPWKARW